MDSNAQVNFHEVDGYGNELEDSPEAGVDTRARSNPFIIVLWALTAGLIVSGIVMIVKAREPLSVGPANGYLPLPYLLLTFAPQVLLAGALTAVALLFWHAARWQKRRAS